MTLGIPGFVYSDLYSSNRLYQLHEVFTEQVEKEAPELMSEFRQYKISQGDGMSPQSISDLLIRMAPHVGAFLAMLFQVEIVRQQQQKLIQKEINTVFAFRNKVVLKLSKKFKQQDINEYNKEKVFSDLDMLRQVAFNQLKVVDDLEMAISHVGLTLAELRKHYQCLAKEKASTYIDADAEVEALRNKLEQHANAKQTFATSLSTTNPEAFIESLFGYVERWIFVARKDEQTKSWSCFKVAEKKDFDDLVKHQTLEKNGFDAWVCDEHQRNYRDGFKLTDHRYNQRQTLYEVEHCIYCHERDTDSCSKGMRNKRSHEFKANPLGESILGCPLGEKISEMHIVKRQGDNIAALAIVIIDNPMCPGTGHRICNDCMRGCIYQKTEAVDIPQIETNVLTDVLFMPYGFEIYSLLTRWNPLNIKRPYALPYNGKNVMVVGMGPAGYTLSHYLLNEGFAVVGIDALKIEPLAEELVGSKGTAPKPIHDFNKLYETLDERTLNGFGGVAEYGITVRWDKNFLKVIYLNLLRNNAFRCMGGVRFGGTLTIEDAWEFGFDHVAIASGAGKPTIIDLKNNMIRGIRKASDFLMTLQLSGASKANSLANLQVRLPAGVIGGGLTAIDTTTEVLAYYPVQVEKILNRYETLIESNGEKNVRAIYDGEEIEILDEFLSHGNEIRAERERALAADEKPDFTRLVNKWGGVSLYYRKGIKDSPAYRQNYEEVHEALKEGIELAEGMTPIEAIEDQHGALKSVKFNKLIEQNGGKEEIEVPIKSLFIAAGTSPNTIYQQEFPSTFRMDKKFFQRYEPNWTDDDLPDLVPMEDVTSPKLGKPAPFTSYQKDGKFVSFYGDNHPVYAGNVVKAMASAKDGYPYISKLFEKEIATLSPESHELRQAALGKFFDNLEQELLATVVKINRLTPTIVEIIVHAPLQARKFQPGQFYRVQNFEYLAATVKNTKLVAEGIALTGAWVDKEKGLISLIALEMGSSSRLCAMWEPGDPLVIMGVTGAPTEIVNNQTIMLIGGGLGNAVQFSIGKAFKAAGNKVIYFAGYKYAKDVFKIKDIEEASDAIVWSVDPGTDVKAIETTRSQDKTIVGNILEAIEAYAKGDLGDVDILLDDVDQMIVIGSDGMMSAVKEARFGRLKEYFKPEHKAIGSINSPMQCMMKGVCAQCLCKHVDSRTGEEYFVYSCSNQDQDLDRVDFTNLRARLRQNNVQEKLSALWLDHLLSSMKTDEPAFKINKSS
ncbi:MAG TPA: pyridine nucleotide-disulfide oxidoreductase [Thiotrichaceae bacterium]|nr:pyridine nucleotide-disulfide oxidoreductase [Thiotrichaceae bacterium]